MTDRPRDIRPGFIPKGPQPDRESRVGERHYPWRDRGLDALALIAVYVDYSRGTLYTALTRKFVPEPEIAKVVRHYCPHVIEDYKDITGKEPTDKAIYQRQHMMFYDDGRRSDGEHRPLLNEHPLLYDWGPRWMAYWAERLDLKNHSYRSLSEFIR